MNYADSLSSSLKKSRTRRGSPSHLGNTARLMLGDILLKMQGRCVLSVQEDDGDGKVPVSAFTRRDGHWPG